MLNPLYLTNWLQGSKHLASAMVTGTHSTRLCWWPRAKHWARCWCRIKDEDEGAEDARSWPSEEREISNHPLRKAPKEANFSSYCIGLITGNSLKAGTYLKVPGVTLILLMLPTPQYLPPGPYCFTDKYFSNPSISFHLYQHLWNRVGPMVLPSNVLRLPLVHRKTWSKNKFNQRSEKMQKQRKTVQQDQITVV